MAEHFVKLIVSEGQQDPKQFQQSEGEDNEVKIIANGRLYIRDLGTLWAYDIKASR